MADNATKTWRNSPNKWAYLKLAIIYFTSPSKVYEIAHKSRGVNMRERIIRSRLVEMGILRRDSANQKPDFDLENGHI